MELPQWSARIIPAASVICVVALIGTLAFTTLFSNKMPGWMFRSIHNAEPTRGAFFMKKSPPYSAQFYFGKQLHLIQQPGDRIFTRENRRWKEASE